MGEVRVRMYNAGFGDCFLITFANGKQMLIDCGTHPIAPATAAIGPVIDHIIETTGGRIDVIVATHRHADHISGFAAEAWDQVTAGEVWLPWTENPEDPTAGNIRAQQERTAKRLAASTTEAVMRLAINARPNARALHRLVHGFPGATRQFLAAGDRLDKILDAGASVTVLGPSRDEQIIREMTPPPDQRYMAHASEAGIEKPAFSSNWWVEPPARALIGDFDKDTLRAIAADEDLVAAVRLDVAINGTSLVLAIEIHGTVLLFAGDAQWGTWKAAVADPAARELLRGSKFYKISHHGSHNGTPVALLDAMPRLESAALSTRSTSFGWDIPREPLLKELSNRNVEIGRLDERYTPKRFNRGDNNLYLDTVLTI